MQQCVAVVAVSLSNCYTQPGARTHDPEIKILTEPARRPSHVESSDSTSLECCFSLKQTFQKQTKVYERLCVTLTPFLKASSKGLSPSPWATDVSFIQRWSTEKCFHVIPKLVSTKGQKCSFQRWSVLVIGQDSYVSHDEVREVAEVVGGQRGVKVRVTEVEVQKLGVGWVVL